MATNFGEEFMGVEYYELVAGNRGPSGGVNGWELFAGKWYQFPLYEPIAVGLIQLVAPG